MTDAAPLTDGIISSLMKQHGGRPHEKGIVTVTWKSVSDDAVYALRNLSDSAFKPNDELGQWVCCDSLHIPGSGAEVLGG
jgi:hypothetical protein